MRRSRMGLLDNNALGPGFRFGCGSRSLVPVLDPMSSLSRPSGDCAPLVADGQPTGSSRPSIHGLRCTTCRRRGWWAFDQKTVFEIVPEAAAMETT